MGVLSSQESRFRPLYDTELSIDEKIRTIATEIYGAKDVRYGGTAARDIRATELAGYGKLPICMAKTQLSITDDPKRKGAPRGWTLTVKEVLVSAGAGFIIPLCGEIMLVPGLPSEPAAQRIDYTGDGRYVGLS
jgi:formate--tetrahydrofolate ligase